MNAQTKRADGRGATDDLVEAEQLQLALPDDVDHRTHMRRERGDAPPATTAQGAVRQLDPNRLRHLLVVADAAVLLLGFAVAFLLQRVVRPVPSQTVLEHLALSASSLPVFALSAVMNNLYRARANERPSDELRNVLRTVAFGIGWIPLMAFVAQYDTLSRFWLLALAGAVTALVVLERRVARVVFNRLRHEGKIQRRIIIVGTDAHAIALMNAYQRNARLGYQVVGFVGDDPHVERGDVNLLGPIDEVGEILQRHGAVGVVVSLASVPEERVNYLARELIDEGFHVALSSSLRDIDVTRLRPQQLDGRTMIYIEPRILGGWRAAAKRVFDVTLATTILIVTAPVHLVAALAVRLTSPGPVYFRQTRVGKDGELFSIIKLRTMVADAEERRRELTARNEADGPLFKIQDDPRMTKVGRVLRKYSIDELPQLFCVLRGSMSMVGPRPALPSEVDQWEPEIRQRLRVYPGLTGMWQISGRSDSSFEQYKRMDLYYVDNWSLTHDLRICAKTVRVVLSGRGAA